MAFPMVYDITILYEHPFLALEPIFEWGRKEVGVAGQIFLDFLKSAFHSISYSTWNNHTFGHLFLVILGPRANS